MPIDQIFTLIFDIDNVVADTAEPTSEFAAVVDRSGTITVLGYKHYLFPGAIEFFKWLYEKPYVSIAFFSSGTKERNEQFVHELLKRIFPQDPARAEQIYSKTIILSREDKTSINQEEWDKARKYGSFSRDKKDIQKVIDRIPGSTLANTVFIDDDEGNVKVEQVYQFLKSPCGQMPISTVFIDANTPAHYMAHDHIFYIASVISDCLARFERGQNMGDFLFKLQFNRLDHERYELNRNYREKSAAPLYQQGLRLLQNYNHSLTFMLDPQTVLPQLAFMAHPMYVQSHARILRRLQWFFEDGTRDVLRVPPEADPVIRIYIRFDLLIDNQYPDELGTDNRLYTLRRGGVLRYKEGSKMNEFQVLSASREFVQHLFRHPSVRLCFYGKTVTVMQDLLKHLLALDSDDWNQALVNKISLFEKEDSMIQQLSQSTESLRNTVVISDHFVTLPEGIQLMTSQSRVPCTRNSESGEAKFCQQNNIFYIVGLLKPMLEDIETYGYVRAARKFIQYTQDLSKGLIEDEFWKHNRDRTHYETGLAILKQINPTLALVTQEEINAVIAKPKTGDELVYVSSEEPGFFGGNFGREASEARLTESEFRA